MAGKEMATKWETPGAYWNKKGELYLCLAVPEGASVYTIDSKRVVFELADHGQLCGLLDTLDQVELDRSIGTGEFVP